MRYLSYLLEGSGKVFDFNALYNPNAQDNIKQSWNCVGESITKAMYAKKDRENRQSTRAQRKKS
ncbi:hypothetical protein V3I05_07945 [Helicobacter mastomyrinus]|uniref:Uncharacterized protein n=1 Tax=Helicobacter mastomyrinus TaxID=287948 RepID=A0ABZ3F648_9HELI